MLLIQKKSVCTSQPQGRAEIDWTNPLTKDLNFVFVAGNNINLVTGVRANIVGTSVSNTVTENGVSLRGDSQSGGNGRIEFPPSSYKPFLVGDATFYVMTRVRAMSISAYGLAQYDGTFGLGLFIFHTSNSNHWGTYSGGVRYSSGEVAPVDGLFHQYIAYRGADGVIRNWRDNAEKLGATGAGSYNAPARQLGVNGAPSLNSALAETPLSVSWTRSLSDAETKSFFANPWQIFKAPEANVWIPTTSGSPPATATVGYFDKTAAPLGWFSENAQDLGWFDKDLLYTAAGAPPATAYTLTAQGGTYAIAAAAATILKSKRIVAAGGSYSLTGQSATLLKSKRIVASGGTYTLTGSSATITYTPAATVYTLIAQGGSYSLTGASATLLRSRKIVASGGTYAFTGQSATITYTPAANIYTLTALGGAYTLTGATATLKRSRLLVASGGAYTLSGSDATLLRSKRIVASGGTYAVTGQSATLKRSRYLFASSGTYLTTGQTANLFRNRKLTALAGTYTLTGSDAVITKTVSGGYPNPSDVLFGVMYGPTGTEYTGTYTLPKFYLDLTTSRQFMSINSKIGILL